MNAQEGQVDDLLTLPRSGGANHSNVWDHSTWFSFVFVFVVVNVSVVETRVQIKFSFDGYGFGSIESSLVL